MDGITYCDEVDLARADDDRRVRPAGLVLLLHARRLLRGDREVPGRPAALGADRARALRREGRPLLHVPGRAASPAARRSTPRRRTTTSCASRTRRWRRCSAACSRCSPRRGTSRSRCRARSPPRSRLRTQQVLAYETGVDPGGRPARRLVLRRGADRCDGGEGHRDHGRPRAARRDGRGGRAGLPAPADRRRGVPGPAAGEHRGAADRRGQHASVPTSRRPRSRATRWTRRAAPASSNGSPRSSEPVRPPRCRARWPALSAAAGRDDDNLMPRLDRLREGVLHGGGDGRRAEGPVGRVPAAGGLLMALSECTRRQARARRSRPWREARRPRLA